MPRKKTQSSKTKNTARKKTTSQTNKNKSAKKKTRVEEGEIVGKKMMEKIPFWKEREASCTRFAGSCFTVLFLIIFIYILNTKWERIGFLTDEFSDWLPFANAALVLSVVTQVALVFFSNKVLRSAIQIPSDVFNLISTTILFAIYPFDIASNTLNIALKIFFVFIILASIVGILVRGVKGAIALMKVVE
jgi:hypothetical protein